MSNCLLVRKGSDSGEIKSTKCYGSAIGATNYSSVIDTENTDSKQITYMFACNVQRTNFYVQGSNDNSSWANIYNQYINYSGDGSSTVTSNYRYLRIAVNTTWSSTNNYAVAYIWIRQ